MGVSQCGAHHDLAAFAAFTLPKILKIEFPDRPRLDPLRRLWAGLSTTRGSILTMTLSRDWHRGFMMVQPLKSFESSTVAVTAVPLESSLTYLFFSSSSLLVGAIVSIPSFSPPLIKMTAPCCPPQAVSYQLERAANRSAPYPPPTRYPHIAPNIEAFAA